MEENGRLPNLPCAEGEIKMELLFKNWENILAILGAISLFFHALEAGCASAGWTKYEGIFSQVTKFIQGFLGQTKGN